MKRLKYLLFISFIIYSNSASQIFQKVEDPSNPIVSTDTDKDYSGAAWIDYNGDGLLDLFTSRSFLFKNTGSGNFEAVPTTIGEDHPGGSHGVSWADFDNDGDVDLFMAGRPSGLYRNDGDDVFTRIQSGDLSRDEDIRGWASAWGDYDEDGYVDLIITHPAGFLGPQATSNHLFHNNGGYMERLDDLPITSSIAPFTVATWNDYDLDGDIDLFIGSGPTTSAARDFIYQNQLSETGIPDFVRLEEELFAADPQDGQVWNWIDYDNDGDLDGFITNYSSTTNHFYQNDGGVYTSLENEMTIGGDKLANTWGDVDNDGDLDVVVTGDSGNDFYLNNGDGTFTSVENGISAINSICATLGDYDDDGDLDLFLSGGSTGKALFENVNSDGNNWINFSLEGTVSNKSALGAKVKMKATINGNPVWQLREISAQNSFNGHNSLRVHFGLGDAAMVDSLIIEWPSGQIEEFENIDANNFYKYIEPVTAQYLRVSFETKTLLIFNTPQIQFYDMSFADPNFPVTSWEWDFDNDGTIDAIEQNPVWQYDSLGIYSVSLTISNGIETLRRVKENYLTLIRKPGIPVVNYILPEYSDTTITKGTEIEFSVSAYDTSGYEISGYSWYKNGTLVRVDSVYKYRASAFGAVPRTDSISLTISNGFNEISRLWLLHVDETTGVEENGFLKLSYALNQNYPNPFNPSTIIEYSLKENSYVKLKIFNTLGEEITELVNGSKSAGKHSVVFDTSTKNAGLASGVYFYRIEAVAPNSNNRFVETKKLILVR